MAAEDTSWERADHPVLRWVFEKPLGYNWQFDRSNKPSEEVPSLSGAQVDNSLRRLQEFELVAGRRTETRGLFIWNQLRVTSDGLRVLAEWPPAVEGSIDVALVEVLKGLANQSPEETEARWYRRAAGAVAKFGTGVIVEAAKGEIRRGGGELGS